MYAQLADLLQFLFAVVVLGLAVTLVKAQVYGDAPTTTKYSTFTGGFGILAAAAGAVGLFVEAVPDLFNIALDGLSGLLFLAGGIAWAVGMKGINCTTLTGENINNMVENGLMNQGKEAGFYGFYDRNKSSEDNYNTLAGNCKKGFSDEIIQFLSFLVALGLVGVGYVRMRRGTSASYV